MANTWGTRFQLGYDLCQTLSVTSVLDMGCGCGLYVAKWRNLGLDVAGYDGNPYTPHLSILLLPEGDEPCHTADLTEDLEVDEPFDFVVCKDVLPYIPLSLQSKALQNLALLTAQYLLIWNDNSNFDMENVITQLYGFGLSPHPFANILLKGNQSCGFLLTKCKD